LVKRSAVFLAALALVGVVVLVPTLCIEKASAQEPVPQVTETPVVESHEPEASVVVFEPIPEATVEVPMYSEQELEMLALVIYQEAGGDACSDETRQMVGEVVLNRVADKRFPGTIYEVITQKAQYGRLYWTGLVWPERSANPGEAHAIDRAYECATALLTGSVERLLPEDTVFQAEFKQGTEVVAEQNGLYFCR